MTHRNRLGANIDHVATIRQARGERYPDPVFAASIAELAGADQITCHIRGDRRHIIDADLPRLRDAVQTQLNVEMAATQEMCDLVIPILAAHPHRHRITLVPEREGEVTTEGGLDVITNQDLIRNVVQKISENKIYVSLFIDPDPLQINASVIKGIDMIEINTARYCEGHDEELQRIKDAAQQAQNLGFEVAAGHGLTHHNLPPLVSMVPEIIEYNIGHSIIARSIFVGLDKAVRDILAIIRA
ncbi:MAG: pyridoxine 5'-phosphate synthase [Deltaproteobacteria bacterium]|nr:pyridoxine 5'-phosphate synthase [Deltaproteobacteria bacterium]